MRDYLVGNDGSAHANVTLTSCTAALAHYTRGARWRQARSEIRSQLSEQPQRGGHAERYRRHDDDSGGEVCCLLSCLEPVSAGNNAPHERVGGLKMSNQICRPKSKGGSCELYGTPFRHRPVRLRKTAPAPEIRWKHHHPIPHNIIDTNRYVHMASLTLPLATSSLTPHRTHAAAPSRG